MSIGHGWYEDFDEDEFQELASLMLKDKLDEVFEKASEIPMEQRLTIKGRFYG